MLSTQENNSFFFSNKWWKTSQTVLSVSLLLLTIFIPLTSSAAINEQINYQGKLTDSAGDAVADASYSIVFRLYTVSSGGTNIWTETQSVTTTNGLFSVMLGSSTSLSDINFNQTLYLGVNVNADGEMSPRKIIGAVPAAFYANDSDTLDGLTASDFLYATTTNATGTISTLNTNTLNVFNSTTTNATTTNLFVSGNTTIGSLTGVLRATAGVVSASLVSLTSDISGVLGIANGGTGTSTQVTNGLNYYDGTRITSGTSLVFNGTNFGIGTSTPGSILSVNGVANFTSATSTFYSSGGINLAGGCFSIGSTCIGGGGSATSPAGSNGQIQFNNAGSFGASSAFYWDNSDNLLGIATSTVSGNLYVKYINTSDNVFSKDPKDTVISSGYGVTFAALGAGATAASSTYISVGGTGSDFGVDGVGRAGGNVYIGNGGDGVTGAGGVAGTIYIARGGIGGTNGNDGTVDIGNSAGSKNAVLNLYGGMRLDTASTSAFMINSGATNYFKVNSVNGNVGIGTSTPGTALSIGTGTDYVNVLGTATSTFSKGIELKSGCFSINGTCISGGGASHDAVTLAGSLDYITLSGQVITRNAIDLATDMTGLLAISNGGTGTSTQVTNGLNYYDGTRITSGTSLVFNGTNFGIGTSTPGSILSVNGVANFTSATSTFYSSGGINLAGGCFSIGSTCIGGGGSATSPAGSSGQIQYNNGGSFGASANFFWDNTQKILSIATTSASGELFVRYINSETEALGVNATTTYIGKGGDKVITGTPGTGGTTYISIGGDALGADLNGGVGGTVNLAWGGVPNGSGAYGANGTVNVGHTSSSGGTMNLYADTLFKDAFSDVGASTICWDGTGGSNIGSCTSLAKYKTNVENLALGLDAVMALTPRKFDWINGMGPINDLGFIAEEVEAVSPQLASYDGTRLNGVKYDKMSALLVKAVQEQQQQISTLQTDLSNHLSTSIVEGDIDGLWLLDDNQNIRPLAMLDLNNQSIINIKSLESSSGKWSLDEEGLFKVVGIEAEKLTVKNGVTTEDKTTGDFYCIYVDEGQLVTESGRCEDLFEEELPELPDDTATTTASTTPPVDEIPQGGGGGDEPNPEPEPSIEETPVVEEPTEDPVTTPDPLPPTPEPEAPTEPVVEEPEPEPTPDPEPAGEEPSAPDASSEPAI